MRTRSSRTFAVLAVVGVVLLAACGSSSNTSSKGSSGTDLALPDCPVHALDDVTQPVNITVWHTQQAKALDTLDELVATYNGSQSKVKVTLQAQGTSYTELMRKFQSAVPSKELPGLVMFDDTATQTMADSGVILPAQSCINADNYDMTPFLNVAQDYYRLNGVLWPASANIGNILLYYNRSDFTKAGLDPDKPPTTLAEVRDDAAKIKAAGVVSQPLVQALESWKTEFWLTGDTSAVVDNGNGRGGGQTTAGNLVDNPQALELFTWFKQMKDDGLLQAIPGTEGQVNQYLAMANHQASMMIETSSAATSVEAFLKGSLDTSKLGDLSSAQAQQQSGLDLAASVFPGMNAGAGNKTQMGGSAWYMTNTGSVAQQAAAWDFMKFMNTDDAQAKMFTGGSYLPYRNSAADTPAVRQAFTSSLSGQWLKIAYDQVKAIDGSFPGPLIGPYDEFRKAIQSAEDQMMFNGMAPADALQQAQTAVDAAISRYNSESF